MISLSCQGARITQGRTQSLVLDLPGGNLRCAVHHFGVCRKKLLYVDEYPSREDDALTGGVMTVAWGEDGSLIRRSDYRSGARRVQAVVADLLGPFRRFLHAMLEIMVECLRSESMSRCCCSKAGGGLYLLDSIGGHVSTRWVDGCQYGVWYEMCLEKLAA